MQISNYHDFIQNIIWLLYLAGGFFIAAILIFEFTKFKGLSVIGLMAAAFAMFSFMALSDPFLHVWDEQFHALVAKNLQYHFLKPTLLEAPILDYSVAEHASWVNTHIWLHKQPLFLWQIALSFKIFGVNLFSLRLPNILMFTLLIPTIYRMGIILSDKKTGFYAAFLTISGSYLLMLVGGRVNTDHNDAAFIFYVTASFWAWFEYRRRQKWGWLIAIGVLSGSAILVKWLGGLIVYAGWGLSLLFIDAQRRSIKSWLHLAFSLSITLATFLPWQIFIHSKYPKIAIAAYQMNVLHLKMAVDGHVGAWNYHFNQWSDFIGLQFQWLTLACLIILIFIKTKTEFKIALISWIFIVHIFFLWVPTKMPMFTFIVAPISMLMVVFVVNNLIDRFLNKRIILFSGFFFLLLFAFLFDPKVLLNSDKDQRANWQIWNTEAAQLKEIDKLVTDDKSRFYNFYYFGDIRFMFYTRFQARVFLPTPEQIEKLKSLKIPIYIFDDSHLPEYILSDKSITKIKSVHWPENKCEKIEFYH